MYCYVIDKTNTLICRKISIQTVISIVLAFIALGFSTNDDNSTGATGTKGEMGQNNGDKGEKGDSGQKGTNQRSNCNTLNTIKNNLF